MPKLLHLLLSDKSSFLVILLGGIGYSSLVGAFIPVIMQNNINSPAVIGIIFMMQRLIKKIVSPSIGIGIDVFGPEKIIYIAVILSIFSSLLMMFECYLVALIVTILYGIALVIKIAAIGVVITNFLVQPKWCAYYVQITSLVFIMSDFAMGGFAFLGAKLYKVGGYKYIFFGTCIWSTILFFIIKYLNIQGLKRNNNLTALSILSSTKNLFISKKIMFWLLLLLAGMEFFGWRFLQILKIVFLEDGIANSEVVKMYAFTRFAMGFGSIIAFFIAPKMSVKSSTLIWLCNLVAILTCAIIARGKIFMIHNWNTMIIVFFLYPLLYSSMQLPPMRHLAQIVPSTLRGTIHSVSSVLILTVNLVGNAIIMLIAEHSGYHTGIIVFCCIILFTAIVTIVFASSSIKRLNATEI